jgi:hypothetical protein
MRDFRDAKVMARALRDALKAKAIEITHAEALELIAKAFGYKNWNILSAKIEAAEPSLSDERSPSVSGTAVPSKRTTRTRDRISDEIVDAFFDVGRRHGWDPRLIRVACETLATTNRIVIAAETHGPSQITQDYIAHPARLAVKEIVYEQRGFHWENASIEVYLHGQSVDIAQGVVSTGNKGAGDQGIVFRYAAGRPVAHHIHNVMSDVWHANPNGKFVIGELRNRWRGQLELRHCVRGELLAKTIVDT